MLTHGEYGCGRIVLDVGRQCVRSRLIQQQSALSSYNGKLLIEVFRATYADVPSFEKLNLSEVLLPGMFVAPTSLENGTWSVLGHKPVDPTRIEFPEGLMRNGNRAFFRRGEISLPVDLSFADVQRIRTQIPTHPSGAIQAYALYRMGRVAEIDPMYQVPEIFSLKTSDLRYSPYRREVYGLLSEDPQQSYFAMSTSVGYDVRRFYVTAPPSGGFVHDVWLCPYCMGRITRQTIICPHCAEDTTRDAHYEMSPLEYEQEPRYTCPTCGKMRLKSSNPCPHCRTWNK